MRLRRSLGTVTADVNIPLGYTLAFWSSGALAIHAYGTPSPLGVFAHLGGAIAAYLLAVLFSQHYIAPVTQVQVPKSTLVNVFSIVAALVVYGEVSVVRQPETGFLVAGFSATAVYLLCLAMLLWLSDRQNQTGSGPD